jgi:SCP-2 sterol transfer family protein
MAIFENDAQVYRTVGEILRYVTAGPGLAPRLQRIDETWRFELREPTAAITARFKSPFKVEFGPSAEAADVILSMSSNDAHAYFLGIFNPQLAIDNGQLSVSGSPQQFIAAVPHVRTHLAPVYRERVQREDPALLSMYPGIPIPPASEREPHVRMGPGDPDEIARAEAEAN